MHTLKQSYESMDISKYMMKTYNESTGLDTSVRCDKCNNRGNFMEIQIINDIPYEILVNCECQGTRDMNINARNAGLVPFLNMRFDNFRTTNEFQKNLKNKAFENAETDAWFYVGGQSGAGKTHITCAIANYLLNSKRQVKYSTWVSDFKQLNYQTTNRDMYDRIIKDLKGVQVLLVDDLFKRRKGDNISNMDLQVAYEIINHRYLNNLKTIFSSEDTLSDLTKLDEALAGRIKEKCGEYVFAVSIDPAKNERMRTGGKYE